MQSYRIAKHPVNKRIGLAILSKNALFLSIFVENSYLWDVYENSPSLPPVEDGYAYFVSFSSLLNRELEAVLDNTREDQLIFSDVIQGLQNIQHIELKDEMVVETRSHGRGIIFKSGRSVRRFVGDTFIERQHDNFDIPVNIPQDHVIFFPISNIVQNNQESPFYCLPRDEIVKVHVFRDADNNVPVSSSSSGSRTAVPPATSSSNKQSMQSEVSPHNDNETTNDYNDDHILNEEGAPRKQKTRRSNVPGGDEENRSGKKRRKSDAHKSSHHRHRSSDVENDNGDDIVTNNGESKSSSSQQVESSISVVSMQSGGSQSKSVTKKNASKEIEFSKLSDDKDLRARLQANEKFSNILELLIESHGWSYEYRSERKKVLGGDLKVPPLTEEIYYLPGRNCNTSGMQWGVDCFYSHDGVFEYVRQHMK